ncbi:MAG TPA: M23 family metallopeptidase [Stenotrophomonas sp.]|nr:M23 family metallopeptidase [Stenotrophomonas sp.]
MMSAIAVPVAATGDPLSIEAVLVPPIFHDTFECSEHYEGQLKGLGDELGTDCMVADLVTDRGRTWLRTYRGDGRKNEDWFGWRAEVLSPCECTVAKININGVTNPPGALGKPPASWIQLTRDDGVNFMLAHVEDLQVEVGDRLSTGQIIARVGNNGYARAPHIHIGAWRGTQAMQIRWDQRYFGDER